MAELQAAYQRIEELKRDLRTVRGKLETLPGLSDDYIIETEIVDCLNTIDESLSEMVVG